MGNMIRDWKSFEQWENELIASEPADHERNVKIFEAMIEYARHLGVWPPADPLEGIEVDIEIARIINALPPD